MKLNSASAAAKVAVAADKDLSKFVDERPALPEDPGTIETIAPEMFYDCVLKHGHNFVKCGWKITNYGTTPFTANDVRNKLNQYYEDWNKCPINIITFNDLVKDIVIGRITPIREVTETMFKAMNTVAVDLDAEDKWTFEPVMEADDIDDDDEITLELYTGRWQIMAYNNNSPAFTAEELEQKLTQYYENWRGYHGNVELFDELAGNIRAGYLTSVHTVENTFRKALNTVGVDFDAEDRMYIDEAHEISLPYVCKWKIATYGTNPFTAQEFKSKLTIYYPEWTNSGTNIDMVNEIVNNIYADYVTREYAMTKQMFTAMVTVSTDLEAADKWCIESVDVNVLNS